jgi:hypothetical protein
MIFCILIGKIDISAPDKISYNDILVIHLVKHRDGCLTNVCQQNKQLPQISYLENKKTTTYGHGYPGPSLQQAQKYGWVKQFNVTPYLIIGSPMAFIQIKINWGPVAQGYPILL